MAWFKRDKKKAEKQPEKKVKIPEGLWIKCDNCKEIIYRKEVEKNFKVCPKCDFHFKIDAVTRLRTLLDDGKWEEFDREWKAFCRETWTRP